MKNKILFTALVSLISLNLVAQDAPELRSWIRNTTGYTGYNNIPADVQMVRYSANYAYINSTGVPNYNIGPWPGNPNVPTNQNFVFKINRTPVENTGTKTSTPLGVIGVWINGVAIFNPRDAMSYNNQNVWHQNAVTVEGPSFDGCKGHPSPFGAYHNHEDPTCLHDFNTAVHSPVIGYAYDGFPIYGPFGYANSNGSGGIKRMLTGYRLRSITQRTTLPDGTVLPTNRYGPPVSATYPLGYYIEDYEFISGLGDLDKYNGRFTVTPEYPGGIYAYFITTDESNLPTYPYIIGSQYYGVVTTENITSMGHVTVTESVQQYSPKVMQLNLLIEGFYDNVLNSMINDSAKIYLRSSAAPYNIIDSSKGNINSAGNLSLNFLHSSNGTGYYIVIRHRNSIETWSSSGIIFSNDSAVYNFSSSQSSAYGNNLIQKGSRYCIFGGDVNQSGTIDLSDITLIYNDASNFVTGYAVTDLNGDNITGLSDLLIAFNNSQKFIGLIRP